MPVQPMVVQTEAAHTSHCVFPTRTRVLPIIVQAANVSMTSRIVMTAIPAPLIFAITAVAFILPFVQ